MRKFYALEQHQRGSATTINGVSADRLHAFDRLHNRDAACQIRGYVPLTRVLAAREARDIYGCKLDDLVPEDIDDADKSTTRLRAWG